MTRRLVPLAFVLALTAAACAKPPEASIGFGSGRSFVPQVADSQDDIGLYPSLDVNADGVPYVAYFGFPEEASGDEVPLPRPIGAPSVPGVLMTSVHEGIWTRGAVAMEKAIPNVDIAFGPAEAPEIRSMKPENVNGTAVAIDDSGAIHVAWVSNTGVWYAHNMDGTSFTASRIEEAKIDRRGPIGQPSIAVDAQGAPWVAWAERSAAGMDVKVASEVAGGWTTQTVATVAASAGQTPARTAMAVTGDGTVVIAYSDGSNVLAAVQGPATSRGAGTWSSRPVESGADGAGVSMAIDADGILHAAYYAGDEIHTATSKDGSTWDTATVSSVGAGDNEEGRSTGVGLDDQGTTYVTWYDPSSDDVHLASGDGSDFSQIETSGTSDGELPSLAVASDGQVYVAWYNETGKDLMLGAYGDVAGVEFAIRSPTPTGSVTQPTSQPTGGPGECTTPQDGRVEVVAENISFDTSCIEIPSGENAVIRFVNNDADTQHNIAVFPSSDELSNPLFQGDLVTGPDTIDYEVGPFDAGEYFFHCDVHPTMSGVFRVASGGGGGGGGGGGQGGGGGGGGGGGAQAGGGGNVTVTSEVTASGLAFDTNEIDLAAGEPDKLTFNNKDAGTTHNIAIYPSESDISPDKALFQGEVVTGPTTVTYDIPALDAGTYYFHCDVHPTMNGSVVVG